MARLHHKLKRSIVGLEKLSSACVPHVSDLRYYIAMSSFQKASERPCRPRLGKATKIRDEFRNGLARALVLVLCYLYHQVAAHKIKNDEYNNRSSGRL